jgi:hypothetical protein
MKILLKDYLPLNNSSDYKIHFGRWNKFENPLDEWLVDNKNWQGWQEYRPKKNEFNRSYIFSLMQFYHESDVWLFGGIFKVLNRFDDRYEVELTPQHHDLIGRLKIKTPYRARSTRVNLERYYDDFTLNEVLKEPYSGVSFQGFHKIDLSFNELETIISKQRSDWHSALQNIKGVYLITDIHSNKRYIGSAYGEDGIWSRWTQYVHNGHAGNTALVELVKKKTFNYCKNNFRFTLLEVMPFTTMDTEIIERESFWKRILFSRGDDGYNKN